MTSPASLRPTILLVSGSLRAGSTNSAVVRTAQALLDERSATGAVYGGMAALPHFNPDDDHDPLPPAVSELREAIRAADAVVFCTPEYAGDMPGSLKNLLDWTVGGVEIVGKATAWINVSTSPTAAAGTHAALRTVLGYTGADIVEDACVHVPVPRTAVEPDGAVHDPRIRSRIGDALAALLARGQRHGRSEQAATERAPPASEAVPPGGRFTSASPLGLPWCWGATAAEVVDDYPCAGLAPAPYRSVWRAVDIAAPAAVAYRWLRQLKVAPYSYDWIDNLGRRSPRSLTPGLDDIAVGDEILVVRVVAVEPGREFTGVTFPRAERLFGPIAGTYRVTPVDDGRCRLVVRLDVGTGGVAGRLRHLPLAWGDLVMMRKQLLTLKHLAEATAGDGARPATERRPRQSGASR